MKRSLSLLLVLLYLLGLTACGGAEPAPEPAPIPTPARTSAPTPEPTPSPMPEPTLAERVLEGMSLREQLCQLLVLRPGSLTSAWPVTDMDAALEERLKDCPAGGFFLDAQNMASGDRLRALTAGLYAGDPVPPLILCDEEGGVVSRLGSTVGSLKLRSMYHYRGEGPEKARENAEAIARELLSFGLNGDLAPVADVWSNPANTVIRYRAYSDDFQEAALLVAAAVEGFHAGGVPCTLKHFPGHGDTKADSHYGSVYIDRSPEELLERELKPFIAGIEAGADMVMVGHLVLTQVSPEPAPFSPAVVTELLREELGFDGVVITDSLEMGAMGGHTPGEAAVKAVLAGVDLLLCPADLEETLSALEEAVEKGELTPQRIRESVLRILTLKEKWGILNAERSP